jgi:hypothetical protein
MELRDGISNIGSVGATYISHICLDYKTRKKCEEEEKDFFFLAKNKIDCLSV